MTRNTAPEGFTHAEWVDYVTDVTFGAAIAGVGLVVFVVGFGVGMADIQTFIVEAERGVMFVEGGLSLATVWGSAVAGLGIVIASTAIQWLTIAREHYGVTDS